MVWGGLERVGEEVGDQWCLPHYLFHAAPLTLNTLDCKPGLARRFSTHRNAD